MMYDKDKLKAKAVIKEIEFRADIWLADVNTGNIKFNLNITS